MWACICIFEITLVYLENVRLLTAKIIFTFRHLYEFDISLNTHLFCVCLSLFIRISIFFQTFVHLCICYKKAVHFYLQNNLTTPRVQNAYFFKDFMNAIFKPGKGFSKCTCESISQSVSPSVSLSVCHTFVQNCKAYVFDIMYICNLVKHCMLVFTFLFPSKIAKCEKEFECRILKFRDIMDKCD